MAIVKAMMAEAMTAKATMPKAMVAKAKATVADVMRANANVMMVVVVKPIPGEPLILLERDFIIP